ncbi:MAG TPA: transposase [Streptosporangiaceae bacterium]|nr:transposase [Streptosporangiaceae bacterium]
MAGRDRFRRPAAPASPAQAAPTPNDDDTAGDADPAGGRDSGPAHARDGGIPGDSGPGQTAGHAADDDAGEAGPANGHDSGPARARDGGTPGDSGPGQAAGQEQPAHADGRQRLQVHGDSAYGSGEARAAYRDAGHDTVIKPKPLQPAVPGGFTLDDFTISEEDGTVTCPAGHVRPMSSKRTVTFGALCAGCPLRDRCTTAKDGRSMTIHPHEQLLRDARAQARTAEFKQAYPTRSAIERIISWTATQNGRRIRLRYLGTEKNDAWLHNRCAAINLRTLLRHGLTRRDGAWVLA